MSRECTCTKKHLHGASRSVVRRIGNSLPINTGKRLYIQLPNQSLPPSPSFEVRYAATGERLNQDEDGLRVVSYLKEPGKFFSKAADLFQLEPITEDSDDQEGGLEEASYIEDEGEGTLEEGTGLDEKKQVTMDKISALEGELAKLKAQIAVIALAETKDLPVPTPPPPPPPPTLSTTSHTQIPIVRSSSHSDTESVGSTAGEDQGVTATPLRPAMTDVLKDIGSVKLRTVHAVRSPGGTPLRPNKMETQEPADNDPASIIALALRKKFANRVFQDSPDKLNQSDCSVSGFDSPSIKLQFN